MSTLLGMKTYWPTTYERYVQIVERIDHMAYVEEILMPKIYAELKRWGGASAEVVHKVEEVLGIPFEESVAPVAEPSELVLPEPVPVAKAIAQAKALEKP